MGFRSERSAELWYQKQTRRGVRIAWLVPDLAPISFPQFFEPSLAERSALGLVDALWSADIVLAGSASAQAEIRRFCLRGGIPAPQVHVVHTAPRAWRSLGRIVYSAKRSPG